MFSWLIKGIVILNISLLSFVVFSKEVTSKVNSSFSNVSINETFKDERDQWSYALGVSLGNYINSFFVDQNKLGVYLNKDVLLFGIKDSILFKSKLSSKKISQILNQLEQKLLNLEKNITNKEIEINAIQGEKYIKNILSQKNTKRSHTGLVFIVEREGEGLRPSINDIVTVNYIGSLINGHEFDNSYKRGKPFSFSLNSVILGWQEGLQYIKKGGRIKLIIPPSLAYGSKGIVGIPGNSTLIFDIELINVKSNSK
ncbi:MAG: FKBP-type peptidyl-prolyl cis-trans isomerase [Buchnera aphidicola (Schlechtendalia peitan)]